MKTTSDDFQKLAIVPARGGSKRIPNKNKRLFNGRPIIEWTLETLIESDLFETVVVSTDDLEIAQISRDLGAEVPFIRPANLADDYTSTADVVIHALDNIPRYQNIEISSYLLSVVYPTGVFTAKDDLIAAFELLVNSGVEHVFSAGRHASPLERSWRVRDDGYAEMRHPKFNLTRTQDLEDSFFDAGQFYCSKVSAWVKFAGAVIPTTTIYELPKSRACDIDCESDWSFAEAMHLTHSINMKR